MIASDGELSGFDSFLWGFPQRPEQLLAYRGFRKLLLQALSVYLHAALEFIDDVRRLPLEVRVAKLLTTMATKPRG